MDCWGNDKHTSGRSTLSLSFRLARASIWQMFCSSSASRRVHSISNQPRSAIISTNTRKLFRQGLLRIDRSIGHSVLVGHFSSYPYSEEYDEPHSYLRARCPAWCDRILLSHSFKSFIENEVRFSVSLSCCCVNDWCCRSLDQRIISWAAMCVWVIIRFVVDRCLPSRNSLS